MFDDIVIDDQNLDEIITDEFLSIDLLLKFYHFLSYVLLYCDKHMINLQ